MKMRDKSSTDPVELRRQAEMKLSERKKKTAPLPATDADTRRLVHELEVHQIQLEMQNEELIQARAEIESLLVQYTDLYDFAPVGYFTLARDGAIRQVNLTGANLLGVERGNLIKRRFGVFVSTQSRTTFNTFLEKVFASQQKENCEVALLKAGDDDPIWAHIEAISNASRGQPEVCHAAVSDITARKQAEQALRQSDEYFRNLAQALPDVVYTLELPAQKVTYFNQDTFLGYSRSELMAHNSILGALHTEDAPAVLANWKRIVNGEALAPIEYRVRNKAGDWEWVKSRAIVQLRNAKGEPTQILMILSTITKRKLAEEALKHLSTHDPLTGLYNRGFFVEEMARLERGREFPVSIVMADLDHLKDTNDQDGHAAGDALLKRIAQVLTTAFRAEDVVARIGGDEFAVLLPTTDAAAAEVALQRVRQVVQENNTTHIKTPIHLSLGVSTADNPTPLSNVLSKADKNMYREKRGRDAS
jgi:diguanylate cyclase (GGDEF)-like protein/PAS domain S-box-containing protein